MPLIISNPEIFRIILVLPSPFPATDPYYSAKDLTAILAIYVGVRIILSPTCDDCFLDGLGQKDTSSKHGQALGKLPNRKLLRGRAQCQLTQDCTIITIPLLYMLRLRRRCLHSEQPNAFTESVIILSLGRNRYETHFPTVRIEAQP